VQIRNVPTDLPVKSPKSLEDQLKISQISEIQRNSCVFESFVYVSSDVVFLIFIGKGKKFLGCVDDPQPKPTLTD
jgi:hypothetical protein